MEKLILIEGLPGSGKTTFATNLDRALKHRVTDVHLFVEGDLHPADTAWCACLEEAEYERLCSAHPALKEAFAAFSLRWEGHVILAYTRITGLAPELYRFLESRELYDSRAGKERFLSVHRGRWAEFGRTASGITVFECALLQNQINELLLFYCEGEDAITAHLRQLTESVARLDPLVVYLDMEAEAAIERASAQRVDEQGDRVWEKRITDYIARSPYGRQYGLSGKSGLHAYFARRRQLELELLERLPLRQLVLSPDAQNQSELTAGCIEELVRRIV